jgi:hypothetical protein
MGSSFETELDALVRATRGVAHANAFPSAFAWIGERYRQERLSGTDLAHDGDVLLLQWGVLDWGDGLHATIDLTRQLLRAAASPGGDPSIWQLHCCFRFPSPLLNGIKNGKSWCAHPDLLTSFLGGMDGTPAWQRLYQARSIDVVVRLARW